MHKNNVLKTILVVFIFAFLIIFSVDQVFATTTITPATGGSAISADTAGGAYTSLIGPVISEGATADIGTGTIILNAPSGFEFDTGGIAPTVLVTRIGGSGSDSRNINDLASGSTISVTRALTTLTITITAATSNGVKNSLTWQNVRVRPTSGAPLASGNITKSGTSSISGITGSTNLGTLTEVTGSTAQLFLNDTTSITAGTRASYTVTRKDQYGNLVTSGNETLYLYSNANGSHSFYDAESGGNIITSITISNGASSAVFWYYDQIAATPTITISDNSTAPDGATGIDDATDQLTITAAVASQFNLNDPGTITAGTRASYTVTRKDQYGNLVASGNNSVYLYSDASGSADKFYDAATDGNIITSIAIADGSSSTSFWYYDEFVGSPTITVSDNASAPDGAAGIDDAIGQISITAASTAQFILNDVDSITAGTRASYIVTRKDQFGNLTTSGNTTSYLYTNSTGTSTAFYDAATAGNTITSIQIIDGNSSANFWYYDDIVGTWIITASDNFSAPDGSAGIIDTTDQLTVNAIPVVATKFTIIAQSNATVGDTVAVTIRAEDPSGTLDTTYNGGVTLVTSGSATLGGLVDVVNGIGSVNITDTVAETVNLSLSDTQSTGLDVSSTAQVIFNSGSIAQFVLNDTTSITAGIRASYTVTRKDQYGNLVASGNNSVYLYSDADGGLSSFYDAASEGNIITSISVTDGNSSANFWYYEGKAGTWNITTSDNSSAPDGNAGISDAVDQIVVNPASVAQFTLNNPGDMTAGTRLGYTVSRQDEFGNLVTSGSQTVYLYSTSNSASTAFYNAASNGNIITSIQITDGNSSVNFWYYDDIVGIWTITVSDNVSAPDGSAGINDTSDSVSVSAAPIVATKFVIAQVQNLTVGESLTVTIRAEDNNGNIDTTYNGGVTLILTGSATGGGLVIITNGVGMTNVTDSVAETITLSLLDTQSTGLNVSSTRTLTFSAAGAVPLVVPGGGGGASVAFLLPKTATVVFSGRTFPGAKLTILSVQNGNIPVTQSTVATSNGDYNISFSGVSFGNRQYILAAADPNKKITQSKIYNLSIAQTLVETNVAFPPTIGFVRRAVTKGGFIGITGYSVPNREIEIELDGEILPERAFSSNNGKWNLLFNTFDLNIGEHKVRARQKKINGEFTEFSQINSFIVVNNIVSSGDLNEDGQITASDIGIFVSKWLSSDSKNRLQLDFNRDGKADAQDFSIFIRSLVQ